MPGFLLVAQLSYPLVFQSFERLFMSEIVFVVEPAVGGGWLARAVGLDIVTEADDLPLLRQVLQDAVHGHFDEGQALKLIRPHIVRGAACVA